ncbi:hypothetical protein [Burkholderia anthina]|uniref:hypothetical protein n=1 Tax=Burkholderia anthina TaxID=179879 RepID=UPI00158B0295|nr:hypothetical protein [Burkholderia anthina]
MGAPKWERGRLAAFRRTVITEEKALEDERVLIKAGAVLPNEWCMFSVARGDNAAENIRFKARFSTMAEQMNEVPRPALNIFHAEFERGFPMRCAQPEVRDPASHSQREGRELWPHSLGQ